MNRLIVAFESESTAKRVCDLFEASSIAVRAVCGFGAEAIRMIRYMGGGVIVCGVKLRDMTADRLYEDLDGAACVLVVAKPEQLDFCENPRIFRLPMPVNRYDLAASVRMLTQLSEMNDAPRKPNQTEQETIRKAKEFLEAVNAMTEEQAHRYLQRQSMAKRRKMAEVAADVLAGHIPE